MLVESMPVLVADEVDTAGSIARVLLIDLENCPGKIQQLQEDLNAYTKVVICYASTGAKIPLDWLMALNETINSNRLQIYKMETVGKNSADFGICFYAGMLAQQLGRHSDFTIVSDDTDLDHLVSLLSSQSHTAKRQGKIKAAKELIKPKAIALEVSQEVVDGVRRYCKYLATPIASRPASMTTLRNHICSYMKQDVKNCDAIIEQLINLKVVSVNGVKISYNNTKIGVVVNSY